MTESRRHVRDARGREVTRLDPITMYSLHQPGAMDRDRLGALLNDLERGLAQQLTWRTYILRVLFGLAILAVVFPLLWLVGDANFRAALEKVLTTEFAFYLPFVIGTFVIPLILARRRHAQRIFRLLLEHRLCPHCGYDMRGLPVDSEDGATLCPECGCAWRMD